MGCGYPCISGAVDVALIDLMRDCGVSLRMRGVIPTRGGVKAF